MSSDTENRVEWKTRFLVAVISRKFDDATLEEMIFAALNQAHAEGLQDAAYVCDQVATRGPASGAEVAKLLATSIRMLESKNAESSIEVLPAPKGVRIDA